MVHVPERYAQEYLGRGPNLVWLLVVNGVAFLVGVNFYVHSDPSLRDVHPLVYPLFGDSPAAIALAILSLATLLPHLGERVSEAPINRPLAYLHTLAFVWLVKYGLWTVLALNWRADLYVGFAGAALWDYWGISITHLLFVVEAYAIPSTVGRPRGHSGSPSWRCSPTTSSTTASATTPRSGTSPTSDSPP